VGQQQRWAGAVNLVIDADSVTIDGRHFLFFPKRRRLFSLSLHPSAIRSPLGNAETEDASAPTRSIDVSAAKPCRSAQRPFQKNYILFERFQIALPLERIGIILPADWHRPGGCRPNIQK
jgi:hypothetical protein